MIRWGIAGTGKIATAMVNTIAAMDDAEVVAVSSSLLDRATDFAATHDIAHALAPHSSLADADVDAVYVATTNESHHPITLDLLDQRIPVLCEKPLALDGAQARQMIGVSQTSETLLMEAMWMVFQPSQAKVGELVAEGRVGEVRTITVDFGFPGSAERLFRRDMGGGSLLDLGVYPLTFAAQLAGPIESIRAHGQLRDGVDTQVGMVANHVGGALSTLTSSILADTSQVAMVAGPEGRLIVHAPFHHSPMISFWRGGELVESWDTSYEGSGYRFEVEHFLDCLAQGVTDSPIRPLAETLAIVDAMDEVRAQLGVTWGD